MKTVFVGLILAVCLLAACGVTGAEEFDPYKD